MRSLLKTPRFALLAIADLFEEHQAVVKALAVEHCRKLVKLTRQDNQKALKVLQVS